MTSLLMGEVMDDITAGFGEMGKAFKHKKGAAKKSHLKSKAENSDNIFYGYSSISLVNNDKVVNVSREKESLFSKDLTRYAKVNDGKICGLLACKCRPLRSTPKMSTEEMMVRAGDHLAIWADSGAGKYGKISTVMKYLVFESEECEMDNEYNGAQTFRLLKEDNHNRDPLKWGDKVFIQATHKENSYFDIDPKGYVRVVSVAEGGQPSQWTLKKSEKSVRISKVGPPISSYVTPKPPQEDFMSKVQKVFE
eukprot:CFRG7407T1